MSEIGIHLANGHVGPHSPSKTICQCCPYGYHIDLDFVRFCEVMSKDSGEPSPSKRQRRERRRQRQSMDVLLGLTSPVIWHIEQLLPPIIQEASPTTPEPPLPPVRSSSLCQGNDGLKKAVLDFEATLERTTRKRGPEFSLDSVSPTMCRSSTSKDLTKEEAFLQGMITPQDLSSFVDFDVLSICSVGSGLSTGPLQNIREQMAISLERMKELEEKVKIIPVLQNQVTTLKNEKSKLSKELKEMMTSLSDSESNLEQMRRLGNKTRSRSSSRSLERKPVMRDVGVVCSVQTREVGVTTGVTKTKSVGTLTDKTKEGKSSKMTNTDLLMGDIVVEDKKIKRLSLKDLDRMVPQILEKSSKAVQVSMKDPLPVVKVPEKRECGVQVEPPSKQSRDVGVSVRAPRGVDVASDARPKTRDSGVSDDKTTDLLCDRCKNVRTKSIGVGYGNVKEADPILGLTTRSKSFDFTNKPKLTRNIAIGTVAPLKKLTSTKLVDTQDFIATRSRHVGMNTNKMKLVDTGIGSEVKVDPWACEKCRTGEKTPKGNASKDGKEKDIPSKIPRPKSNATTPVMERKKFQRQDTYTKITQSQLQDALSGQHSKNRKKVVDKPESNPDDTIAVVLRKKNKDLGAESLSEIEHRLSKDLSLKDLRYSEGSERFSANFDCSFDYDENYDEPDSKRNSQMFSDAALFQPIQDNPREKFSPSKEMRAAMKVVNDSLHKHPNGLPRHLKNASNIIQQEWFKVSSSANANPLDVEDYVDSFEEVSSTLLEFIVNMTDNNGNTAMHYAVSHGNFDVVSILLDSKVCNINKANAAGYTCVMLVSLAQVRSETHRQVVMRLFQLADVNIRAKQHGQTALMLAVSHGRLDMVQLLLQAGADTNIQDGDGSTALMCAAEHGHVEIVKHILAHPDCDPSIVDCDGSSALAIAMEAGNRDIGVLLYAREHFGSTSRGSSPYTSMRQRKNKTPNPKTPTSPSPNRKSDHPASF